MVIPRSRSRSMLSRTWASISRAWRAPVVSRKRSASVDLPWSMCAMIEKLRTLLCINAVPEGYPVIIPHSAHAAGAPGSRLFRYRPGASQLMWNWLRRWGRSDGIPEYSALRETPNRGLPAALREQEADPAFAARRDEIRDSLQQPPQRPDAEEPLFVAI